jgi:tetratricopeptide (TPR) repeat protein
MWPWALAIFAVAAAARVLHVWQIRRAPFFTMLMGDARGYDAWATRIAGGEWLGGEVFYQAPLYPYFLGAIYAIAGHDLLIVRIVQALVGAASCTLLGLAGARLFSPTAGVVAGLALALYAPAIFFDGLVQKSVLDVFFVCLAIWLMSRIIAPDAAGARRSEPAVGSGFRRIFRVRSNWLFLGLAMGGLALTRENAMVLIAVLMAWAIVGDARAGADVRSGRADARSDARSQDRAHGQIFARAGAVAAFVLGLTLVLLPVAVRNYAVGGGFYLTTSQFGPNFFIGNNPKSDGTYMSLRFGRGAPEYERQDATELAEHALGRTLAPSEVSSYWTDRAMAFITTQPGAWLRLLGRKFLLLWNADEMLDTESQETYAEWSWPLRFGGWIGHFGVLVPIAVVGMWAAWPDRRRLWVFPAMAAAYAASVIMFYVFARYRFPLVPFLVLFASVGLSGLFEHVRERLPGDRQAPAAIPSRGRANPRRGISEDWRWGWGPSASERKLAGPRVGRSVALPIATVAAAAVFTNWPVLSKPLMQAITENNLAVAFQESGRLDEAIAHYRRSLAFRPDYAPAYNNMGAALRAKGQLDETVASYERALAAVPDYADAHYNLANALLDRNQPQQAAAHFRQALAAIPGSAGARNNLGIALANEGRFEEAAAEFRAALAVEPDSAKANRNLGKALSELGRRKEAIGFLRRAVELDPNDHEARYDLGSELLVLNQPADAAPQFEAAVKLAPDWAGAHNNLGIALGSLNRLDEAIAHFQQALEIQPDDADAKRNLAIAMAQKKGAGR